MQPERLQTIGGHIPSVAGTSVSDTGMWHSSSGPPSGAWEARHLTPAPEFMPKVLEFLDYLPGDAAASPAALVGRLTALWRRLRLARSTVAGMLGLSYATLWAWETGRRRPRGRSLALLQEFIAMHDEGDGTEKTR